jgi:murein DD-endopeptidase MepM/ murein hydrolase activator NlpD
MKRGVWTDPILRIIFVYSLVYVIFSLGLFLTGGQRASGFKADAADLTVSTGVGMSYQETVAFVETSGEGPVSELAAIMAGAPEPLEFSKPQMLLYTSYKMESGDNISTLAMNFGLNQDTLLSINDIKNSRSIPTGKILRIPNQDGISYKVKEGDNLQGIAEKYNVEISALRTVNELFSERVNAGSTLFIPGVRMNQADLQEINGDLFIWPVRGYITSRYGYRPNPFGGGRSFHTGLDIGASTGTPIKAGMDGRVSTVGYNEVNGNYVVITHHSGYRSQYLHMSVVRVKSGAYVRAGDRIGDVGSTGLSTGPHLHFTVYKNGVTINPQTVMH